MQILATIFTFILTFSTFFMLILGCVATYLALKNIRKTKKYN
jgi:hypothetical protein